MTNNLSPYKAVIFDLDGTLVNSLSDIADAMNHVLSENGFPTHTEEAYKYFVGNGIRELVLRCLPETERNKETVDYYLGCMLEHYRHQLIRKSRLYDGIPQLLDELTQQGMKMAVLSNKADHLTQQIVSQLLHRWSFEQVLGASDRFPRKPDPAAALFIAKQLGVTTTDVLYLGDTGIDMATATAAGFVAVGVSWGFRLPDELRANGAKFIIDHPLQLLTCLGDTLA